MSAHTNSASESRALCIALFAELQQVLPLLERVETEHWCGFFQPGDSRFAYIHHYKTDARIQVWCRGVAADWQTQKAVFYVARTPTDSSWQHFHGHFDITARTAIKAAAEALYLLSYSPNPSAV